MKKIYQFGLLVLISGAVLIAAGNQQPNRSWDYINLKNDIIEIQVVPKIGGRVIQYKLGDYSFFWVNEDLAGKKIPQSRLGPNGEWLNYGGDKVWPAPQGQDNEQRWPGPPDPVLDGGPYTAELTKENDKLTAIKLTSEEDKRSGIQFSRKFKIFDDSTRVSIEATMENIDTKPRRWGVWVVTQFDTSNRHGDGHNKNYWAYCPINPDSMYHKGYNAMFGLVGHLSYKPDYENGMMRVHYDYRVGKIGMDSSAGWLATLDATDGYVFVHRFTYEPGRAYPDNASVEFWLNGPGEIAAWGREIEKMPDDTAYLMESEVLSPFASLEPGESYTFHYDWYTAKVPPGSDVTACNDIGVTCKPLSAKLCNGKLVLDGSYGIFYKGSCCLVLLDKDDNEIKKASAELPVTPLKPLILSKIKLAEGLTIPDDAEKLAVYIYDVKGQLLDELAKGQIQKN
ncbi:MAG: DUF4380 domain-containing protein [Planctomycetota bacterium]|nr:MAG: DUF4380 domain-containing protein [Planctomycetota bacterium]